MRVFNKGGRASRFVVRAKTITIVGFALIFLNLSIRDSFGQESCANLQYQLGVLRSSGGAGSEWDFFIQRRMQQLGCFGGQGQTTSRCPAGTEYCPRFNLCCGSGNYCSVYGCIQRGSIECGGYSCSPGNQCSRGGGCIPDGAVDCGSGSYCQEGSVCWTANGDIPGVVKRGEKKCTTAENARLLDERIAEIDQQKRREREAAETRERWQKLAEKQQKEAALKLKQEEKRKAEEEKRDAIRRKEEARKAEIERKKAEAIEAQQRAQRARVEALEAKRTAEAAAKAAAAKAAAEKAATAKLAAERAAAEKSATLKAAADKAVADRLAAQAAADKAAAEKLAAKAAADRAAAEKIAAARSAAEKAAVDRATAAKMAADKLAAKAAADKAEAEKLAVARITAGKTAAQAANKATFSDKAVVDNRGAISDTAKAINLSAKAVGADSVARTASGVSAVTSGLDTYKAYKQGDRLGTAISAAKTVASTAEASGYPVPLVGPVASMAGSAQSLGTALGTRTESSVDKGLTVGASGLELLGKSAAAGAGYLIGGAPGASAAVKGADVTLSAGKFAGEKITDSQFFKNTTDGWLQTKTNESRAAEYQRLIDELQAQRTPR